MGTTNTYSSSHARDAALENGEHAASAEVRHIILAVLVGVEINERVYDLEKRIRSEVRLRRRRSGCASCRRGRKQRKEELADLLCKST